LKRAQRLSDNFVQRFRGGASWAVACESIAPAELRVVNRWIEPIAGSIALREIAESQDGTRVGPFAPLQGNFLTVLESNRDSSKQLKREKELSIRVQELCPDASKYLNRGRR
jgi:hypothetical protein